MVIKFCLHFPDKNQQQHYLAVPYAYYTTRQRALKPSHYYPNTHSRIDDVNFSVRSMPIGDRTQTNRQKNPNLGSIFLTNYGKCSYTTPRCFHHSSTKLCNKSFHSIIQIIDFCLLCKTHWCWGCNRLKRRLTQCKYAKKANQAIVTKVSINRCLHILYQLSSGCQH